MTEEGLTKVLGAKSPTCPDCAAGIGKPHEDNCDVERCFLCGGQALSCGCSWTTAEAERRLPWTGWWPGKVDAVELDLWCLWGPDMDPPQQGWVAVEAGTPGARPDLNMLYMKTVWNPKTQRRDRRTPRGV